MKKGVVESFTDMDAFKIYFGWYAFTVLAWAVLPGKKVEGVELRNGGKLTYPMNGEWIREKGGSEREGFSSIRDGRGRIR